MSKEMSEFVRPEIQKVLKSYHQRAPSSLKGPGLALNHSHKKEIDSLDLDDELHSVNKSPMPHVGVAPALPHPILSAPDNSCGILYRTDLEGRAIGSFLVGGEMRLCLPQVYHLLKECSFAEINRVIEYLGIDCSQSTPEQLNEFKVAEILPDDVKSCGLITRTNAERLCSILLHQPEVARNNSGMISFMIYTNCFDKCQGICTPELYSYKSPACIQCIRCNGWFSPQRFVCHAHKKPETYTCHWGFNSSNWRCYIQVDFENENREQYEQLLDRLKDREQQEQKLHEQHYREQREYLKRRAVLDDTLLPTIKTEPMDIPTKKAKIIDEFNMLDYHRQLMFLRSQQLPFMPFMPISPLPSPHSTKSLSLSYPVPPQFSEQFSEPPVLQNPERVVRLSESQRFESTFQPNVALAPRKKEAKQDINQSILNHTMLDEAVIKQEQPEIKQEPPGTPPATPPERFLSPNSGVTAIGCLSNTPFSPETSQSGSNEITSSTSPVPAILTTNISNGSVSEQEMINLPPEVSRCTPNPIDNIHHRSQISTLSETTGSKTLIPSIVGVDELELSTDTDDESVSGEPDSSSRWDISSDLLREIPVDLQEKLKGFYKQLVVENNSLRRHYLNIKRHLQTRNSQIEQLLQRNSLLQQQLDHSKSTTIYKNKVADPTVITPPEKLETIATQSVLDRSVECNGFVATPQNTSEIIIKPFKKSIRRSPEDTVVIMQPIRDEIKIVTNGELIRSVN